MLTAKSCQCSVEIATFLMDEIWGVRVGISREIGKWLIGRYRACFDLPVQASVRGCNSFLASAGTTP